LEVPLGQVNWKLDGRRGMKGNRECFEKPDRATGKRRISITNSLLWGRRKARIF
jgi:hypothetical protein